MTRVLPRIVKRACKKDGFDEKTLEKIVIKAFKQHWEKIAKSIKNNQDFYANKRYRCFEADTTVRQKILSKKFYSIEHAKKIASLNEKMIKKYLLCYLPRAIEYAMSEYDYDQNAQKSFMKKLVSSEYVIFDFKRCDCFENYNEHDNDLSISEYPANVGCDDWYERIAGLYGYNTSILMKSTGEAFSKTEINWLKKSIQDDIDGCEPDLWWWFECEPLSKNKLWIKIYDFIIDESLYMDGFLGEAAKLSTHQFQKFVCQTMEHLSKEEKTKKQLRILNNHESMEGQYLLDITQKFFRKNWEAKILSNYDIRIAENIMNDITGRKDRNYHSGINFA